MKTNSNYEGLHSVHKILYDICFFFINDILGEVDEETLGSSSVFPSISLEISLWHYK